jgi:hypothetical protein
VDRRQDDVSRRPRRVMPPTCCVRTQPTIISYSGKQRDSLERRHTLFTIELTACRQNCNCQIPKVPRGSIEIKRQPATGSTSISCEPQISTNVNMCWNLVRDQVLGPKVPDATSLISVSGFWGVVEVW